MNPAAIIVRPIVSEKSENLQVENNQYTFEVVRSANKIEIRKAVAMTFGVRVKNVQTSVVRGDKRRVGRFHGKTRSWKKAIVTLAPGESIALYGEQ